MTLPRERPKHIINVNIKANSFHPLFILSSFLRLANTLSKVVFVNIDFNDVLGITVDGDDFDNNILCLYSLIKCVEIEWRKMYIKLTM